MSFKGNDNKSLVDDIVEKTGCKRNSARTYASTLVRVGNLYGGGYNKDLKFIKSPKLLEKLKNHDGSLHSKRNLINSVLIGFKLQKPPEKLYQKYKAHLITLNKEVEERGRKGIMTEKQKAKMLEWKQVEGLRKLLEKQMRLSQAMKRKDVTGRDLMVINQYVAVCCMTLTPPTRLDWPTVTFHNAKGFANIADKTSSNMLVVRKSSVTIIWNDYKTARKHGQVSHELPKKLASILRKHVKFMKKHFPENDRLFLNARFEPMSRHNFGKLLESVFYKYFKKRISVSALRRIYLSSKYSHSMIREAQKDARMMMHSVNVAQNHYVKEKDAE